MDLSAFSTGEIAVAMVFTGIVVVFCALVGLWVIVALFGKLFSSLSASRTKKTAVVPSPQKPVVAPPPKPQPPAMKVEDGIGDEVVAVIAAAVAAASGGKGVVRGIKRVREGRSNWAQAGVNQNTQPF